MTANPHRPPRQTPLTGQPLTGAAHGMTAKAAAQVFSREIAGLRTIMTRAANRDILQAAPAMLPVIASTADSLYRAGIPATGTQQAIWSLSSAGTQIYESARQAPRRQAMRGWLLRHANRLPLRIYPRGTAIVRQALRAEEAAGALAKAARPDIHMGTDPDTLQEILPALTEGARGLAACMKAAAAAIEHRNPRQSGGLQRAVNDFEQAGDRLGRALHTAAGQPPPAAGNQQASMPRPARADDRHPRGNLPPDRHGGQGLEP